MDTKGPRIVSHHATTTSRYGKQWNKLDSMPAWMKTVQNHPLKLMTRFNINDLGIMIMFLLLVWPSGNCKFVLYVKLSTYFPPRSDKHQLQTLDSLINIIYPSFDKHGTVQDIYTSEEGYQDSQCSYDTDHNMAEHEWTWLDWLDLIDIWISRITFSAMLQIRWLVETISFDDVTVETVVC